MASTPAERRLAAQVASHARWAQCDDRTGATAKARAAAMGHWERKVDPEGVLAPDERAKRADSAMKSHMARMRLERSKNRIPKRRSA